MVRCSDESRLECEREADALWLAEVAQLPGVLAHGSGSAELCARWLDYVLQRTPGTLYVLPNERGPAPLNTALGVT